MIQSFICEDAEVTLECKTCGDDDEHEAFWNSIGNNPLGERLAKVLTGKPASLYKGALKQSRSSRLGSSRASGG